MTKAFAAGKKAFGFCDRCGQRAKLALLKTEFVRGKPLNNRVCPSCWDPDHPQNWQGTQDMSDPQALRNPRPDTALQASRNIPNQPGSAIVTETQLPVTTEGDQIITTEN
jgi:hypothetical protein